MSTIKDHTSLSNFDTVLVKHTAYQLDVDFGKKVIEGYALVSALVCCQNLMKLCTT